MAAVPFIDNDAELTESFLKAEKVTSTLLSRLRSDPGAVDSSVWALYQWDGMLWALKQQVMHGPCEEYRGTEEYKTKRLECNTKWIACCARYAGETRLKKWEKLGTMSRSEAAHKFIQILNDIIPGWNVPPTPDVALLTEWSADSSSYCCSNCNEGFTLLNRRHHCRRCSRLVCAPCSSNRIGLRLFPGVPQRMQRVCNQCIEEIPPRVLKALAEGQEVIALTDEIRSEVPTTGQATTESIEPEIPPIVPKQSSKKPAKVILIKRGYLDRIVGTRFHKTWERFFFVLLIRKGSVGIYIHEDDVTPSEVYKLSNYAIRVKSEKRRPHQFKVLHETNPSLRLCAESLREMNDWIAAFSQAIESSNLSEGIRSQ
ncbi:hypothetical protein THRCLA_02324 [Thraustotheca clavata]|uniref:Uncharacterized protein n=1 Tax=Thraustotheca clavata TaxID=74557 RepID=A0A1W0A5K5_9STRA|nr:hypothetical protein THRCLA_02324 [Thraustotheca clavata]